MADPVVRRRALVTGRVQGVFFRASIQQAASHAGVCGTATNREDGSVEVVLEGPAEAVESVIGYCHTGPANAHVEHVEVRDEWPEGLAGFRTL